MSLRVRGNAWVQSTLWATSDRRLNENINELDFSLEHFSKLRPVSFNWKNEEKTKLDLISQEVFKIAEEAVNLVPNEKYENRNDDDIEGYQMLVDYQSITMMNVVAVKKLIERVNTQQKQIETLQALVEHMIARPVVSKWLAKQIE